MARVKEALLELIEAAGFDESTPLGQEGTDWRFAIIAVHRLRAADPRASRHYNRLWNWADTQSNPEPFWKLLSLIVADGSRHRVTISKVSTQSTKLLSVLWKHGIFKVRTETIAGAGLETFVLVGVTACYIELNGKTFYLDDSTDEGIAECFSSHENESLEADSFQAGFPAVNWGENK